MSPSALSVNSQYGTPSSVRSGGWTLEQKSAMFPAHIEDDLVTTQYESPITDAVISKNQSDCEKWLESHDLTSPWQGAINSASKKLNRSRISSKSYSRGVDAWTQTVTSLPPNFNLFDFLEKHGAPIQSFSSRDNSISGSANSSLRRKLFESVSDSESDPEPDFQPVHFSGHSPRYDTHLSPRKESPTGSRVKTDYEPVTPGSEQFSSSPIKVSPGACSSATSPGALSCVGGDFQSPYQNNSPYRSPFRSPFDANLSLSPILPKNKISAENQDKDNDVIRSINFEGNASEIDSDLEETALDPKELNDENKQTKLNSSLLDDSLDVSMRSDSWDVSSIQANYPSQRIFHGEAKNAESTHIQPSSSRFSISEEKSTEKEDQIYDDVYMVSCSQESRGFSFCEPDEPNLGEVSSIQQEQTDSGISSAPNSRLANHSSQSQSEKSAKIPMPTFHNEEINLEKK